MHRGGKELMVPNSGGSRTPTSYFNSRSLAFPHMSLLLHSPADLTKVTNGLLISIYIHTLFIILHIISVSFNVIYVFYIYLKFFY